MTSKGFKVAEIANRVRDYDADGASLRRKMIECGWTWDQVATNHPDLTAEEIASAAACGFEVEA